MAYTETKNTSWGERLGGAFKGVATGLVLILLGSWLLWWNEGRTYKTAGAIGEAMVQTQDVADISTVDPALEGKVVHAMGRADTTDVLTDPAFGVSTTAIALSREVEYYQWTEHEKSETRKKLGGGEETVTTYTYSREWVASPIDSSAFHDPMYSTAQPLSRNDMGPNDTLADFEDEELYAQNVSFGAYKLPPFLVHRIGGAVPMALSPESVDLQAIAVAIHVSDLYARRYLEAPVSADALVHVAGSTIYIGQNPGTPKIGDVRVTFRRTPPTDVSIIAKVMYDTFEEYVASNGYTFSRLAMGKASMEKMFEDAKSENSTMAWILRIVGIVVVIAGLRTVLSPLAVLVGVLPILESLVGAGIGLVSLLLGLAWSFVVIAVAWVRFRPLLSGSLLAAAVVFLVLTFIRGRRRAA
ncbi:TMEM43 family protein [uncultured Fretibacterium sp.]|uniref:TMEM43 family protein n=1 Tax=uncultured Fretibacterium sp. TaxID=1678694 RepID=UPI00262231F9|nr:TMEM43 family protein [uncultured Fretibacterium sp.]